jgi:hypothetical protein
MIDEHSNGNNGNESRRIGGINGAFAVKRKKLI